MSDFELIKSDRLLSRIEDELSTFQANNILDIDKFYSQIKFFMQQLGRAVEPMEEVILKLDEFKADLPCNFYQLDSAWLCDSNGNSTPQWNLQDKYVLYTQNTCEIVTNPNPCGNNDGLLNISACNMENVWQKDTVKEYVSTSEPTRFTWRNPKLLRLNNKKSVEKICSEECKNMFSSFPEEISIKKQGNSFTLFSTLKTPIIYVKYYAYPLDKETGLPMIPDHSVFEEAIFYHCVSYFLRMAWLNKLVTDVDKQIQYFDKIAAEKFVEAKRLSKFPSFNKMVQLGKRSRSKWASYEIMNTRHH